MNHYIGITCVHLFIANHSINEQIVVLKDEPEINFDNKRGTYI